MNLRSQRQRMATYSNEGGEKKDAFELANQALHAMRPNRSAAFRQFAASLRHRLPESTDTELRAYLAKYPADADAIHLMARAKIHLGLRREAKSLLARCLELAPDFTAARFEYAQLLAQFSEFNAALRELDKLLVRDNGNPLFRQLKANILGLVGKDEESLVMLEQLATENPARAELWIGYGHALRAMGLREKSIGAYRKAIECHPSAGTAYWSLANMKTVRFSEADIDAMQKQLKRGGISTDERFALQFSLGKAFEDLHAYDRSYEQYARANAGLRLRIKYDPDVLSSGVARNKALFTSEFFHSRSNVGCPSPDPIFILGRPRSGSTLVEQILSSHSAVEGTAELPYIAAIASRLGEREGTDYGAEYLTAVEKLAPAALAALGELYLDSARFHRKLGRPFFIDKKPANFHHIGLIHLILPNAKIVDVRRHPAACCLSDFKHYNSKGRLRLAELGRLYRDYVELLAHFDIVLPGRIHRVIYEDLVANPETEIRRLFDYLALPFEEACLRFYETDRTITTPSAEQVRKPLSAEAIDHWRHYEPWLGALIKSLGSALTLYPSVPEELR